MRGFLKEKRKKKECSNLFIDFVFFKVLMRIVVGYREFEFSSL